jgi:hypothetical protein
MTLVCLIKIVTLTLILFANIKRKFNSLTEIPVKSI